MKIKTLAVCAVVFLALCLLTTPAFAEQVPFSVKDNLATSFDGATDVYAADIDGDGDLDVVAAACDGDDVAWWENTAGDGSAWTKHQIQTVDGARGVHAADIDGDGDMDVLAAAQVADKISWWENDGTPRDGGWDRHDISIAFNGAWSVHAADLDGDGDMDVLGAASVADDVVWWQNGGDGSSWTEHAVDSAFNGARYVEAADVDGDGDLDILGASSYGGDVAWWENRGYWAPAVPSGTYVQHFLWVEAWSARNTLHASFGQARGIHAADIDGDGDLDIVAGSYNDNDVAWWENDGGTWSRRNVDTGFDGVEDVYPADLDGDGDIDLLGVAAMPDTDTSTGDVVWWENTAGNGSTWTKRLVETNFSGAISIHAADLDGDGDMDIVGAATVADDIAWWENEAIHRSAYFSRERQMEIPFDNAAGLQVADVNGDGTMDVIGTSTDGYIAWQENDGSGSAWTQHLVDGSFDDARIYAVDLDSDGDTDILGGSDYNEDIVLWYNDNGAGTLWTKHVLFDDYPEVRDLIAADLDGDGDQDVIALGRASEDLYVVWWENSGDPDPRYNGWTPRPVDLGSYWGYWGCTDISAVDLDGDGDLDLLVACAGNYSGSTLMGNGLVWLENDEGTGLYWTSRELGGDSDRPTGAYAGDLDGDGDLDVVSRSGWEDGFVWWENDGSDGPWTGHTPWFDYTIEELYDISTVDLDGDGDLDILGGTSHYTSIGYRGPIVWWENDGSAGTWTLHSAEGTAGDYMIGSVGELTTADFDGDGKLDLIGRTGWDTFALWTNVGGQFGLDTTDISPPSAISGWTAEIFKITLHHNGRSSDGAIELTSLELLFEESKGDPLTSAEANAIIDDLSVYRDDGSGEFEGQSDALVATLDTLGLSSGIETIAFTDGDTNVQTAYGSDTTYFVVVDLAPNAGVQSPNAFRITHLTEASSTAEDSTHDIPLSLEYAANVSSEVVAVATPSVIYVNENVRYRDGCHHNGLSWDDAFYRLQDALGAATSGTQIWVAEGLYYPDEGMWQAEDDPTAAFSLINGVTLYGGFDPNNDRTTFEERDWRGDKTVLSGDIDADAGGEDLGFYDDPIAEDVGDIQGSNAYHVVSNSGVDATAVLDGFYITAGQANGTASPHDDGGGMINDGGSPTLRNLAFSGNLAVHNGGGMHNVNGSSPTLTTVTFTGNRGDNRGGAIANMVGSNPTFTNAIIADNASGGGGGAMFNRQSSPTLTNVTIAGNHTDAIGGGLYNWETGTPTIANTIIWSNTADVSDDQIYNRDGAAPAVVYSDVEGGYPGTGNIDADPLFVREHDRLWLQNSSPAIDAGDSAVCPSTDLRDLDRDDWRCDMGAYEVRLSDADTVTKTVAGVGVHTFGPTLVKVDVGDTGGGCLTGITVQRLEEDHPDATVGINTGRYWNIEPIGCSSGFALTLTLPYSTTADADDRLCRYTDPGWDCGQTTDHSTGADGPAAMPDIITRRNVTAFSEWAAGDDVGPSAVRARGLAARGLPGPAAPVLLGVCVCSLAGLLHRRRWS